MFYPILCICMPCSYIVCLSHKSVFKLQWSMLHCLFLLLNCDCSECQQSDFLFRFPSAAVLIHQNGTHQICLHLLNWSAIVPEMFSEWIYSTWMSLRSNHFFYFGGFNWHSALVLLLELCTPMSRPVGLILTILLRAFPPPDFFIFNHSTSWLGSDSRLKYVLISLPLLCCLYHIPVCVLKWE